MLKKQWRILDFPSHLWYNTVLKRRSLPFKVITLTIRTESQNVANDLPVGLFGIDDVLTIIEIINGAFQLWQACSASSSPSDAVTAAQLSIDHPLNNRRARRAVRRAARKQNKQLSDDQLDALTTAMLNHVVQLSQPALAICCAEPPIKDDSQDE